MIPNPKFWLTFLNRYCIIELKGDRFDYCTCSMINRFQDKILSGKEQNARRAAARRGSAMQTGKILAGRYEHFAMEASIYGNCRHYN